MFLSNAVSLYEEYLLFLREHLSVQWNTTYISTSRRNTNKPFQVLRTAFFDEYNFVLIVTNVKSKDFLRHTENNCSATELNQNKPDCFHNI